MITKIKVLDGGKGQVINKHPKTISIIGGVQNSPNPYWEAFDKSNPAYDIIGPLSVKVGDTVDAELVWQWKDPFDNREDGWMAETNDNEFTTHEYSVNNRYQTRLAWQLTPEKEEKQSTCPKCKGLGFSAIHNEFVNCSSCDATGRNPVDIFKEQQTLENESKAVFATTAVDERKDELINKGY